MCELIDNARAAFDKLLAEDADRLEYFVRLRLGQHLRGRLEVDDVLQEVGLRTCRLLAATDKIVLFHLATIKLRMSLLAVARYDGRSGLSVSRTSLDRPLFREQQVGFRLGARV